MDPAALAEMAIPLDQLEKDLLQLPRDVRAHLADVLAASVEKEVAAAWDEEAERRHEAFLRGGDRGDPGGRGDGRAPCQVS